MGKRVLDVGRCGVDHAAISHLIRSKFGAEVVQTHGADDTLRELRGGRFDLVLINRKLDQDYTDGLPILEQIKADPELSAVPVMLVTNYPEHQQQPITAGGEPGFGKNDLRSPQLVERLRAYLGS